ncbi:MAG: ammonia-forming cytochrome c nitrite reductase [Deltaproteobacteria bacterium]|jgi:nitrite reductase (cytochrome c-552)|nr:ammonia-forming cytochrome c nitrite reductase [Deltaproteobacteria bacterium]
MNTQKKSSITPWAIGIALFCGALVGVLILGLIGAIITTKRAEVSSIFNNKKVDIVGIEPKSAVWGLNFPREYRTWSKTAEMNFSSKHLGNKPEDILESRPNMVVLWAGYAFSRSYKAPRGHWYTLEDVYNSLRVGAPGIGDAKDLQPSTCWTCKSPDVPRRMQEIGIAEFYKEPWSANGTEIVNPLGCADCHNPADMELTITRPGLIEAFQRQGKDVTQAGEQELRSLVCAQCHVEYYFKGDGKYLTLPWDKGMTVEQMEEYYDELEYFDYVHAISKTPIIKAQHPDYEIFLMGPHGQKNLSCADCHMPYISEGGIKYSNHQVMSPLANVSSTCAICHRDTESELIAYVYERQDKVIELRDRLEPELVRAHVLVKAAMDAGATDEELLETRKLIRAAQWRWDYIVASHGASFHAPLESARVLSHGIDKALQAQLLIKDVLFAHGVTGEVPMPDLSTKANAQQYVNLDMPLLESQKAQFVETIVPQWLQVAKENGRI